MKFGIHAGLWMARWTDEIVPILRIVADLGLDGVEISLLGMTDEKAAALADLIRDHGLEVTCSGGLSKAADITSADPAVRAAGLAHLNGRSVLSQHSAVTDWRAWSMRRGASSIRTTKLPEADVLPKRWDSCTTIWSATT